ncbi:MAG TPA: site-2 protease family protein, partial [Polyangia bacterium]
MLVLLALGALALVHELGHLAGARALGLTVTDLSIGLGPPLRRWRLGDVTVALAPIPFGGFVRVSELLPEAAPDPARFRPRRVAARLLVTIAGSLANLLLAGVLAAVAALCCGADTGRIAGLQVTSAGEAAAAGLRPGDVVERIDGVAVASVEELGQALAGKRRARLAARRAGRPLALEVTPLERG